MDHDRVSTNQVRAIRLGISLAQGLALYLLTEASQNHVWPSTNGILTGALFMAWTFVPIIVIQGVSLMRLPRLIAWAAAAAVIAAGLGGYGAWREIGEAKNYFATIGFALNFFAAALFFISHALVTGGEIDRRFMATYPTHFDVAWKLALQLILTLFFELAFWGLLWLGALLFQLIGLDFLRTLITHRWFAIPATALVVAGGIHLTDMQPGLVRGMRTLVLTLFSWLLPLLTLLTIGFLVALPFTGLQPLWRTGHASAELLSAAACLIILINAVYQDGNPERAPVALLRYAGMASALALIPIVILAWYAITLRIGQYGWTTDRVASFACVLVAGFYAAGYAMSVFLPGAPLRFIERWNFAAALLILAVLLSLLSPLADPSRIAVNSQVARLRSGVVGVTKFDFNYLRNSGLRFGHDALVQLAGSSDPATHERAQQALKGVFVSPGRLPPIEGHTPAEIAANVTVYPRGKSLPQSFLIQDWTTQEQGSFIPHCDRSRFARDTCEALVADVDGDGKDDVLILTENSSGKIYSGFLFQQLPDGIWHYAASLGYPHCDGDLEALRAGRMKLVPSAKADAMIADRRIPMNWMASTPAGCPTGH